ncbi:hypothetical protein HPB51_026576 [Rhipicephalus microplus]|uniref:Uncharacterized protein n=1 Tax=Rhipicephalus microplus TaxID=6941 RepID=A0A9J6D2Q7_RHIMP|nr:hypothetical protein HPB51_026576 [Rhipicephalus microplus]
MVQLSNVSLFLSAPVFYDKPSNNAYYNSDNASKNYEDDNNDYNDGDDDYDNRDPRPSRVDPESLDESAAFLDTLRNGGIKHYGLLTVLTFQSDYNFIVSSTREIIALCQYSDFSGGAENYIGDPVYTYGGFSNSSKSLTLSEYKDSLAAKPAIDVFPAVAPAAVPPILVSRDAEGNRLRPGRYSDGKRVRWLFWQQRLGDKDEWDVPCSVRALSFAAIALGILTVFVIVALWVAVRNQREASETTSSKEQVDTTEYPRVIKPFNGQRKQSPVQSASAQSLDARRKSSVPLFRAAVTA